jgi:hypothetical protein
VDVPREFFLKGGEVMQRKGWVLVFVCLVLVLASVAYAQEPSVTITDAYTTDYMGVRTDQFKVLEPVYLHIEYSITGVPRTIYRSVGTIGGLGSVITMKDRVLVHERGLKFDETRVITAAFADKVGFNTIRTVNYKVRLFLGTDLLDVDTATSTITIVQ